jgi:eukaryotic-like serine/threonine-protein kinase
LPPLAAVAIPHERAISYATWQVIIGDVRCSCALAKASTSANNEARRCDNTRWLTEPAKVRLVVGVSKLHRTCRDVVSDFWHLARVLTEKCETDVVASPMHDVTVMRKQRRHGGQYGDYEVVAPLASGGMGGVYLATHVTTGDYVALKVLDPQFANNGDVVARLYSERAISARATHPGLVAIHATGRSPDGTPYLVMEYLEGRELAHVIGSDTLTVDDIIGFGAQIAAALAALHAAGIVHCDVKPENIFVLAEKAWGMPQVKVIDFGVSRVVDEPLPEDSAIAGTPAYMSPEQWRGKPQTASDVYSLGCVLYELLTGEPPFDGSLPEIMVAHLEKRPARPSWLRAGVPIELERLVLRALAKAPAMRPTMEELATELGDLVELLQCSQTMPMALAV